MLLCWLKMLWEQHRGICTQEVYLLLRLAPLSMGIHSPYPVCTFWSVKSPNSQVLMFAIPQHNTDVPIGPCAHTKAPVLLFAISPVSLKFLSTTELGACSGQRLYPSSEKRE